MLSSSVRSWMRCWRVRWSASPCSTCFSSCSRLPFRARFSSSKTFFWDVNRASCWARSSSPLPFPLFVLAFLLAPSVATLTSGWTTAAAVFNLAWSSWHSENDIYILKMKDSCNPMVDLPRWSCCFSLVRSWICRSKSPTLIWGLALLTASLSCWSSRLTLSSLDSSFFMLLSLDSRSVK